MKYFSYNLLHGQFLQGDRGTFLLDLDRNKSDR